LDKLKFQVHLRAETNGSFESLEKFDGDISKVVSEGWGLNLDIKTNADEYIKNWIGFAEKFC